MHRTAGRVEQRLRDRLHDRREAGPAGGIHRRQEHRGLVKIGFEDSGVKDMISYEEFKEKGYFVVPTDPDWEKHPAGLKDFHDDPENHPLKTPSGKMEFYSQNLAKHFPDDPERPPVPHWIEKGESHDETLSSERAGNVSPAGRCPTTRAGAATPTTTTSPGCGRSTPARSRVRTATSTNRSGSTRPTPQPRGIANGDVVKIYNERGAVLAGRLRDREDHAGRRLHGPRRPVRPHRARGTRPGRGHQHPHPAQPDLQERHRHGVQRLPGRGGDRSIWTICAGATPRPSAGLTTAAPVFAWSECWRSVPRTR